MGWKAKDLPSIYQALIGREAIAVGVLKDQVVSFGTQSIALADDMHV